MIGPPKPVRAGLAALSLVALTASAASAQTDNHFALGVDVTRRIAQDPNGDSTTVFGPTWRWGHTSNGWGWSYGLNWFSTDVAREVGGTTVELGHLHLYPFMVGYGYTRVFGRTAVTGGFVGGYAIASIKLRPAADDALRERLGARTVSLDAANTIVGKPQLDIWRDINDKVGINISVSYMIARPTITVRSSLGEDSRRDRADMLQLSIGAVYSLF